MQIRSTLLTIAASALAAGLAAQQVLNSDSAVPFNLARTPGGNFLVPETGTGANDGRLSLLSVWGARYRLLAGLPSGSTAEGPPLGPTAVADAHSTVYVVISEGSTLKTCTPGAFNSPLFSAVIRARFSPVPDGIRTGFELTPANIDALADGEAVTLENDAGERVSLDVLSDIPNLVPDARLGLRQSDPYGAAAVGTLTQADLDELGFTGSIAGANFLGRLLPGSPLGRRLEERTSVYVVDAGMNVIWEISASSGRRRVLVRFPAVQNSDPQTFGPETDPVPTSIFVREDGTFLVTTLGGFPFEAGSSKVWSVDPAARTATPLIEGLTSATNVLEVGGAIYVAEVSTNLLANAPGRLLRFASPTAQPEIFADGLIGPTGLAYEPTRNEIIVSETFTSRILRFPL